MIPVTNPRHFNITLIKKEMNNILYKKGYDLSLKIEVLYPYDEPEYKILNNSNFQ